MLPVETILTFCKTTKTPITALNVNPHFDEKKGRVSKGQAKAHTGWNKKYSKTNVECTPFNDLVKPHIYMMCIKELGYFVIDIDVKGDKTAQQVLSLDIFELLYNTSSYVIQTGSGGLHFYYKLPDDFNGEVKDYININIPEFFEDGEEGSVDIIMHNIITEGSEYYYQNNTYSYKAVKGSINDVAVHTGFQEFYNKYCKKTTKISTSTTSADKDAICKEEIMKHLDNIPNTTRNWGKWYEMAQIIFNTLGKEEGLELFDSWSKKNEKDYNQYETYKLWRGLSERSSSDSNDKLTVGSLLYYSREANEEQYFKIRSQYQKDSFWELMKCFTHYDCAKYFFNYKPFAYIYKSEYGWYSLLSNNTWLFSEKKPALLIKDIAETFKRIIMQKKNEIDLVSDDDNEKTKLKQIMNFNKTIGSAGFCENIGTFLQTFYLDETILNKMDENRHLFAFTDKVADLDKNEIRDIKPQDYISITTGYAYPTSSNPKVRHEIKEFLFKLFEDNDVVEFELRKMSYALHGNKKFEKFVIETGKGRNGKGTNAVLVKSGFGGYYQSIPITTLTKPADKKDAPNPALVSCRGKRFIEAQEPEKNDKLQVGLIKELTGNDIISCRGLYGKTLHQFVLQGLLQIQANGIPKYNKIDKAIIERNIVQDFPFQFTGEEGNELDDNQRIGDANIKSKVGSIEWRNEYILMLIENYQKIKNDKKFIVPEKVKNSTAENTSNNIPIKDWYETWVEKDETVKGINTTDFYQHYVQNGGTVIQKEFAHYMELMGHAIKKTKTNNVYVGIKVKEIKSEIRV